ncbi:MAG: Trm112 family protein [Alphaproteobacteria bacterium TMED93]|nr:MAG: tetraacyldisaccharide 4'-kinase [Betaproteobacteria bacterium TMED156]RPH03803.1 MAG: Trm112 family protein [Alphaproteobacteria bacterium TMED93]|tara:strand:+ start:1299 stop:1493 length:195 start_codon:yes stop_codon:yes gene_type:complete
MKKDSKDSFDVSLLDIIVCPVTKEKLSYDKKNNELLSSKANLAFPIKEGIPILLLEEARKISRS